MANLPRQVEIHNGLEYARRGDKPLYFDLFQPYPRTEPTPLIISIHGGGWRDGTRGQLVEFSYDFAANGYATAQIDYRLADGDVAFPAPVADVLEAIRYFQAHAQQFGIDPNRIGLYGASAGGHLAMLAGMSGDTSRFDSTRPQGESPGVKAVISFFGPTDLTTDPAVDLRSLVEGFLGRPLEDAGDLRAAASPIGYVRSDGPALLVLQGDADSIVPVDQARRLVAALQSVGQNYVYLEIPGMEHLVGAIWQGSYAQENRPRIFEFLAGNL